MTVRTNGRADGKAAPDEGTGDELALRDGHRVSVIAGRDGSHELAIDGAAVRLDEDEADTVARALGSAEVVSRLSRLQRDADGLLVEQLPVPNHSPYSGRPLGDTRMRSRTGASIVAVLRSSSAQASPKPDFVLFGGDLVVVVGTREGLDQVGRILEGTG